MNSREAIDKFYDRISWADQCEESYFESHLILIANPLIYLPVDWEEIDKGVEIVVRAGKFYKYKLEPSLLITGDAPKEIVEKSWWMSCYHNPLIHCEWINKKQQIWYNRCTTKALDGIDWNKSFETGNLHQ